MEVTDLITAIHNLLEDNLGTSDFELRQVVYSHSISQLVPRITLTYLVSTDNNTVPDEYVGSYRRAAVEVTRADMEDKQQVTVTYMHNSYYTITKKTGQKVLFMSLTAQEYTDYNAGIGGKIDDTNTVVKIQQCGDDFSGGWRASDVINYVRSEIGGPSVSGMPDYWIRQYRLMPGRTLFNVVQDLYGFMRPQLYYASSGLTIRPEPMCAPPTGEFCIPTMDEFSTMTYTENRLGDSIHGVAVFGGSGLFDTSRSPVKLGERYGLCIENSTEETSGTYSYGYICYDIDEFGRKVLRSTHKEDYDKNKILAGQLMGGLVKSLTSVRNYRYNSIEYEEPIPISENISGEENIYSTDSNGDVVQIGYTALINGSKLINYDPNTFMLNSIDEVQKTMIHPVTLIEKDASGNTAQTDGATVYKTTSRTELYNRSSSEVYGVAVAQTTETPVFQQPQAENSHGGINKKTVVDHIEVQGETSFQEAMGSVTRAVPRKRKMQIVAHAGSTTNNIEVSNPNIVVASDADRIASAVYNSSVRANWVAQTTFTFHTDEIYGMGSKMGGRGYVASQNITLNMGTGTLGFDLTNTVTVVSKFAR